MNKRGIVFIFAILVTLVLCILLGSFYFQSISENWLATRFANSTRAFWLAESGIASALSTLSGPTTINSYIDNPNYSYSVVVTRIGTTNYYNIVSTGTVASSAGPNISRTVAVTVRTGSVDATKYKYGIETTTDLIIKGSVDINPDDSTKEYSALDFSDLFGISKADMKANATHTYTSTDFGEPVIDGITWVDVPTGSTLTIAGNLSGSGILVINGDAHFSGTVDFDGIIYVIGKLTMTGTVTTFGSVLAESSTTVDTVLKGNVTINYSPSDIATALGFVQFLSKQVVSWQE